MKTKKKLTFHLRMDKEVMEKLKTIKKKFEKKNNVKISLNEVIHAILRGYES